MSDMLTSPTSPRSVLVTGATGYLGRALVARLVERGHHVKALVRANSTRAFPANVDVHVGDALDARSIALALAPGDALVQLVGTPKPAPWKASSFRAIDRASAFAAIDAARGIGAVHFVYVSVAQPAPVMRAYIEVRAQVEARVRETALDATILRPWYVVGPGHHWPRLLAPLYALLERIPNTRESALRLGLVTHADMTCALVHAVENPMRGVRILDTLAIRNLGGSRACSIHS